MIDDQIKFAVWNNAYSLAFQQGNEPDVSRTIATNALKEFEAAVVNDKGTG